jgi:AcrR family transcriptional regulator
MATDDTRHRILNAAGEVFAEKGYAAATIREICGKAGANLASVNYYFGDKERLYVEVLKAAHPGSPEAGVEHAWPEDMPPEEKLKAYIRQLLERLLLLEERSWKVKVLHREILDPTPFCKDVIQGYFQMRFAQIMSILDEILPAEMPSYRRHQVALSIVGQCVYFRAAHNVISMVVGENERKEYHTVELLAEHVFAFASAALGLGSPLARRGAEHAPIAPPHGEHKTGIGRTEQDQVES